MAGQTIGSTRIFVLTKGFVWVGNHSALIGEYDIRRLYAEIYSDPARPNVRQHEAYQVMLSSI